MLEAKFIMSLSEYNAGVRPSNPSGIMIFPFSQNHQPNNRKNKNATIR
jgi:hypothetical protein